MPAKEVYKAINKIQADLASVGIAKNQANQQQRYMFRGIDDIYNTLSRLLAKHELVILPEVLDRSVTERTTTKGGVLFYTTVQVKYTLVSANDDSQHSIVTFGEAMDSGDKSTNKAMSAAYKYACLQLFCIPTEGDNEADATTHEVQNNPAPTLKRESVAAVIEAINNASTLQDVQEIKKEYWPQIKATEHAEAFKAVCIEKQNELGKAA